MTRPTNWRQNPFVRFFSSVRVGVVFLFLVLVYACVFSALPQVRGALEMTEMQAFSHWLFTALIVLTCTSVTVVSVARIRWRLINLGVLTVHSGLLVLAIGAMLYFGTKIEGDVPLRTPRIELISTIGSQRIIGQVPIKTGESWSNFMPAFGGQVSVEVTDVQRGANGEFQSVELGATQGAEAQSITLTPNQPAAALGASLRVRMREFPAESRFFDREHAAMFFRPANGPQWVMVPLPGLPIFRERFLESDYAITDTTGTVVHSQRTSPHFDLWGMSVPTGWFEQWRMPIQVTPPTAPFAVEITGFLPYIAGMRKTAVADPQGAVNPALRVQLTDMMSGQAIEHTLFAASPTQSFVAMTPPLEFRWVEDDGALQAVTRPLAGPHELTIHVDDPPVDMTVPVDVGAEIAVEGTPYTVRVQQFFPQWPLMSPGFESAVSPAALVEVTNGDTHFTRTVIQRFPDLSQDIDASGMRKRDGLLDPKIQLRYRTSGMGWLMLCCTPEMADRGEVTLAAFQPDGSVDARVLKSGEMSSTRIARAPIGVTVGGVMRSAREVEVPVVEPTATRRPNVGVRSMSAVRLRFTKPGDTSGWSEERWANFSSYPDLDSDGITVQPPGVDQPWEIVYSRVAHDLKVDLLPGALIVNFFPGRRVAESWRSDFTVVPRSGAPAYPGNVETNRTFTVGPWTLFQSSAANDHWSFTVLGVGSRLGVWPMTFGCVMITLGCLFAFYVKPVLRKRAAEAMREKVTAGSGARAGSAQEMAAVPVGDES
ncbi:MAG: hypothetical protein KDA32_06430 [Phycisphaerales bacterium]|nr:hypothetical protein [Phycisphaerales bacterium]